MSATKKPKLVRDSFTIPKAEFAVIDQLKERAMGLGRATKKSELLRAGLKVLAGMSDDALRAALASVPTLKTGRPAAEPSTAPAPAPKTTAAPKANPASPAKTAASSPRRRNTPAKTAAPRPAPVRKAATKTTPGRASSPRRQAVRAVK